MTANVGDAVLWKKCN